MGGCRCTYRNCTVKTDGKTHMFHYPVFEKVRCHQWLVNAHKLEFLNLKVSQLKNRVVCQHHFREENFMNYKKDKLTFDAIPTEDGPFCDPTKFSNIEHKPYSNLILLEDIENDYQIVNKKANFSLKYGDFLTNGEIMDSTARNNSDNVENLNSSNYNNSYIKINPINLQQKVLAMPSNFTNKDQIIIIQAPPESNVTKYDHNITNTLHEMDINKNNMTMSQLQEFHQNVNSVKCDVGMPKTYLQQDGNLKKEPKVKILSETKIQWPLPITGKFEKMSPDTTLYIPERAYGIKPNVSNSNPVVSDNKEDNVKVLEVLDVECIPKQETGESDGNFVATPKTNAVKQPSPRVLPNKSKLTPERTAAIERKRKFNMKLKDAIESCLNKIDEPIKNVESDKIKLQRSILKDTDQQETNTPKEEPIPNIQEYTMAFVENRMNKMEETLLNRIDKNSQKIVELKQLLVNNNKSTKLTKFVNAQTNTSEECYKKFLYREISTYLSENVKNLIYEELFINKFSVNEASSYNRKRRKCV